MITHFDSFNEYLRFVGAKYFWDRQNDVIFVAPKGYLERVGEVLTFPLIRPLDFALRNLQNPLFITALVIVGIVATSILFYPATFISVIGTVVPPLLLITPSVGKFTLYLLLQSTILGLFMRTWGRLNPSGGIMAAWNQRNDLGERRLVPITIGVRISRV